MENISVQFKGIQRQLPYQSNPDGALDELINLRHYKGRLEPVGAKTKLWETPTVLMPDNISDWTGFAWVNIWVHEFNDTTNYIGLQYFIETDEFESEIANRQLRLIDMEAGTFTSIKDYTAHGNIKVEFLKGFMIVIYDGSGGTSGAGMDRFVWKNNSYTLINVNTRPEFSLYKSEEAVVETEIFQLSGTNDESAIALRGKYYELLNSKSNDGFITGTMFVRAAIKLFDGSYVLHTMPRSISVNNFEIGIYRDKGSAPDDFKVSFTAAKIFAILPAELYTQFSTAKDVIQSVVLFGSKFETVIDWSEDIDDSVSDMLASMPFGPSVAYLNTEISAVNPDYIDLCDSLSWYKIGEYSLSNILEGDINEELDLSKFYQDYATRETLPIDNFTHHELAANVTFNYNSRLVIADVSTKFGDYKQFPLEPFLDGTEYPNIAPTGYTSFGTRYIRLLTTIETDSGTIYKLGAQTVRDVYNNPSAPFGSIFIALAVGELGYPDARATKIEILASDDAVSWFKVGSYSLKKSKFDNFAYYIIDNFTTAATAHVTGTANYPVIMHLFSGYTAVNLASYPEQYYLDSNRVQISEVNNPFYFPAKNSYQVGTGRITDVSANTEPLSTGQFGEYPLMVFTTKGIWGLLQGSGEVLYLSVVPVSGEVANPGSVVSVGFGVTYSTPKGLFLLQGKQSTELTKLSTGLPNTDFQANVNYRYYISHDKLVQLLSSLSTVDILDYISVAKIGYDQVNNELIVTNSNYSYSYVYNFDSGIWFKLNKSYQLLINYYPKLLSCNYSGSNTGVFDLSTEIKVDEWIDTLITTQPMMFGSESFKVIRRMILRTLHETRENVFNSGFYIFGSSDLINWQRVTGRNHISGKKRDILLQRSGSKFKYFIVVFAGKLKVLDSYIGDLNVSFDYKANNKLR